MASSPDSYFGPSAGASVWLGFSWTILAELGWELITAKREIFQLDGDVFDFGK